MRAIFFDAAGTLFESREPVGAAYARIARQFGLDAPASAVDASFRRAFGTAPGLSFGPGRSPAELRRLEREWWRERVAETFARLGKFADFDAYFDALFAHFGDPANWIADLEAAPTLRRLKNDGFKLGVISNFDHRLYRILDGLDLTAYFDSITISSEAGYAKPHRGVFDSALSGLGVGVHDAMHVGDSEHLDLAAAGALGIAAVLIARTGERGAPVIEGRTARICSLATVPEVAQIFEIA
ncbi:MAG TPA: HAD-IA family hydrolase [Candidatus Acidoferrales bacterium]|nr:HAD-IA family hydrolase [Candidatus Acidoferrales bacterium]